MTLYELVYSANLQGNIRVSMWKDDKEKVIAEWKNCDCLYSGDIEDEWMDFEVSYMFCGDDGFLHIEVTDDSDNEDDTPVYVDYYAERNWESEE